MILKTIYPEANFFSLVAYWFFFFSPSAGISTEMSSAFEISSSNASTMKANSTRRLKISGTFFFLFLFFIHGVYFSNMDYTVTVCVFCPFRKACSLDVEISASGYTKELQQDDQLLHPVGPEGDGTLSGDEDDAPEAPASACDASVDMDEYEHAILELEGLKISSAEEHAQEQHGHSSPEEESCSGGVDDSITDTPRRLGSNEEPEEDNEDECPELVDLSAFNKEFKPFR